MKHKLFIITFLILLSGLAFGQRDDGNVFSVKIKFDKEIPVEKIQVY